MRSFRIPKILIFGGTFGQRLGISHIISENETRGSCSIFDADSWDSAVSVCDEVHPDLVLIVDRDLQGEGMRLCQKIRQRENGRHTGIIFYSQVKDDELAVACLERGFDDYLRPNCSSAELKARLSTAVKFKMINDNLRSLNHHLRELSMTDELTGLANMRQFHGRFSQLREHGRHHSMGVIMMDLDHFKGINDNKTHLMGSHVIAEVGKILHQSIEGMDLAVAARYGGDEYIIALPVSSPEELKAYCERIRMKVEQAVFVKGSDTAKVTCSLGAAFVDQGCALGDEALIKAADMALYTSKDAGRNHVSLCHLQNPRNQSRQSRLVQDWKAKSLLAVI